MFEFLIQHQFWAAVITYWVFSAAVSAMPEPGGNGSPGYLWLSGVTNFAGRAESRESSRPLLRKRAGRFLICVSSD